MKKIILCCDGTWNRADQEQDQQPCPTNVVRLAYRVASRDGTTPQIVYYDQGVGTGNLVDKFTGGAFGEGLEQNVHDAYRFLVANHEPGDQIFLFGFSRGAFTARSIAGMIRKCGILERRHVRRYAEAVAMYRNEHGPDEPAPVAFREAYSADGHRPVPIHFIGVWDTVGALGIPLRGLRWMTRRQHQFYDTELSGSVKFACHALAIDEHRAPFEPTLWSPIAKPGQIMEQVWFAGVHSDVGGGYKERAVSDLALAWMIDKASVPVIDDGPGLRFDPAVEAEPELALSCDGADCDLHESKTGLYRVTPGLQRPIGLTRSANPRPDPTQTLHPSVLARWDRDPRYRPANLRAFLQRIGDRRASA